MSLLDHLKQVFLDYFSRWDDFLEIIVINGVENNDLFQEVNAEVSDNLIIINDELVAILAILLDLVNGIVRDLLILEVFGD
jgi:hypothetical protein